MISIHTMRGIASTANQATMQDVGRKFGIKKLRSAKPENNCMEHGTWTPFSRTVHSLTMKRLVENRSLKYIVHGS